MAQDIKNWNPDDKSEWESTGKTIANRNLWISIPSLLGFLMIIHIYAKVSFY
jgi:NNP family nitrate/nitrite transporter-like MFS transporter